MRGREAPGGHGEQLSQFRIEKEGARYNFTQANYMVWWQFFFK